MNDVSFEPDFLEDLKAKASPEKLQKAESVCGKSEMCLYDSLALNDTNIGRATLELDQINIENMELSSEYSIYSITS